MKKQKLNLYNLDLKYVNEISKLDNKVMSISPQEHKENRPFVGVIVIFKQKKFCVPLTSPKPKHQKMKNSVDFSKIFDKDGKLLGALNFNNMIPITEETIRPIMMQINSNDSPEEKAYKNLLNNQLDWCNKNADNIIKKASKLYDLVVNKPNKNQKLIYRCCDFKILEEKLEEYTLINSKEQNETNSNIDFTNTEINYKLHNNNLE